MNRRAEILQELVRYKKPTGPLMLELNSFGWDWLGEPLLILKNEDLLYIIDRFLADQITAAQLQEWAENLEAREDVAFDKKEETLLDDVFFRIATPFINEPLTKETAQKMRDELCQKKASHEVQ
ncbi:MAG: hypothetical protein PHD76_10725 [Methylacidiphilales bacterium]|nr:hypothetical protein [Candidatus Methylacidiphilales bacterium]